PPRGPRLAGERARARERAGASADPRSGRGAGPGGHRSARSPPPRGTAPRRRSPHAGGRHAPAHQPGAPGDARTHLRARGGGGDRRGQAVHTPEQDEEAEDRPGARASLIPFRSRERAGGRIHTSTPGCSAFPTRAWSGQQQRLPPTLFVRAEHGIFPDVSAGASVLIAEDDYNFRDTLEDALVEDGQSVVCARNGAGALVALNGLPRPALVLLDLHMPIMDGITFMNELRKRPDAEDFEVVVMSAVVDPERFGKLPGVVRAMKKPFDIGEIQALVSDFADRRRAPRPRRQRGTGP